MRSAPSTSAPGSHNIYLTNFEPEGGGGRKAGGHGGRRGGEPLFRFPRFVSPRLRHPSACRPRAGLLLPRGAGFRLSVFSRRARRAGFRLRSGLLQIPRGFHTLPCSGGLVRRAGPASRLLPEMLLIPSPTPRAARRRLSRAPLVRKRPFARFFRTRPKMFGKSSFNAHCTRGKNPMPHKHSHAPPTPFLVPSPPLFSLVSPVFSMVILSC